MQTEYRYITESLAINDYGSGDRELVSVNDGPGELDELFQRVGFYSASHDFRELCGFIRRFPKIGPYNALLLHIQRPGCTFVATAKEWKTDFNRTVKPGARPLVILRPFGPVNFVFDLQDTDGPDPFPEDLLEPFKIHDRSREAECRYALDRLLNAVPAEGIAFYPSDFSTAAAGYIETAGIGSWQKFRGHQLKVHYNLVVSRNLPPVEMFASVLHELGHLYCGHLGTVDKRAWPDRKHITDAGIKEFEAECVSWIVCSRMGIDSESEKYLADYLDQNSRIPDISLEVILKAAGMIETRIKKGIPVPKSLKIS